MSVLTTNFVTEPALSNINGGELFCEFWRAEARDTTAPTVFSLSSRGLGIAAPPEAKSVVLRAQLAVPVAADSGRFRVSVVIRSSDRTALRKALLEFAILRVAQKDRATPVMRLAAELLHVASPGELRLEANVTGRFTAKELMFELRFRAGLPEFTISKIEIDVVELSNALAPPPEFRLPRPNGEFGAMPLRVAVVTWQTGDNPFGRAHVLADMIAREHGVVLFGSAFARSGQGIWKPLANTALPVRSFEGGPMEHFLPAAQAEAERITCDIVYLSKPRFPGMLLALLLKHRLGCPVVLDIDDHEAAFFSDLPREFASGLTLRELDGDPAEAAPEIDLPHRSFWTGVADMLIPTFEDRTVSNLMLAERFGGLVVRHARDETIFAPDQALRENIRATMELREQDRVIFFAGTPRRHKGLDRLMAALERLADPRLLLVVVGTIYDGGFAEELAGFANVRTKFLQDLPFSELPALLQAADGVCLLQDLESPISTYQTPAKISDALALGIPVAATPAPPIADMIQAKVITPILDDAGLDAWLLGIAEGRDDASDRQRRLDWFDAELCYTVNGARIRRAFSRALGRPMAWNDDWTQLFAALNRRFGAKLPEQAPAWAKRSSLPAPVIRRNRPIDLVCFWKQNDTGLYGQRHDMLIKYLKQNENIGEIIQFDAPIAVDQLLKLKRTGSASTPHPSKLIADATSRRFLELDDEPGLIKRTFVYRRDRSTSYLGRALPRREDYQAFVAQILGQRRRTNLVSLSWPIAPMFKAHSVERQGQSRWKQRRRWRSPSKGRSRSRQEQGCRREFRIGQPGSDPRPAGCLRILRGK